MISEQSKSDVTVIKANPSRKTFRRTLINRIPDEVVNHPVLIAAREFLPSNYDFELPKTIWRIMQLKAQRVALQFPEGLQMFAIKISDILENATGVDIVILSDVTYGACCVDDFTAKALKVDLLVHYGHSCLIPIDMSKDIDFLYVFVNIHIDMTHFEETICYNFDIKQKLSFVSTIQFVTSLHEVSNRLKQKGYTCLIPQKKPLSPGEILGCTAPTVSEDNIIIYLGDGRFHLEAVMIANPNCRYFRYDPYEKKLTEEFYEHEHMRQLRFKAINRTQNAKKIGIILGTLGRQGSIAVLDYLMKYFEPSSTRDVNKVEHITKKKFVLVLLSEILPQKLDLFDDTIDAWIQIACPRLSIDWGESFKNPLLTPYEAHIALTYKSLDECSQNSQYPMDYYAEGSLGPWTPKHKPEKNIKKHCKINSLDCCNRS